MDHQADLKGTTSVVLPRLCKSILPSKKSSINKQGPSETEESKGLNVYCVLKEKGNTVEVTGISVNLCCGELVLEELHANS